LLELFFRLGIDFLKLLLVKALFFLKFLFQLLKLAVVARVYIVHLACALSFQAFTGLTKFVPLLLSLDEVLPQNFNFFPKICISQLNLKLELLAVFRQLTNFLFLLGDLLVESALHVLALSLELVLEIVELLRGFFLADH
jgi:hypothetical protein